MLIHIVRRGDTLSAIARQYGVSVQRLLTDNGLSAGQRLVVGQALIVTLPAVVHRVRPGDSLYTIALQYGTTVTALVQNNPELVYRDAIYPGQELTVRFRGNKTREITTLGFAYPTIRRRVLLRALPFLTYLAVFSYGFTASGSLIEPDDAALLRDAAAFGAAPMLVLTSITEEGGFSSEKVADFLADPALQNAVLDRVLAVMRRKGYVGMDVDFEYIPRESARAYLSFLTLARARLGEEGFTLNVDLAPKTSGSQPGLLYEAHDYPAIGQIADTVHLMTYEWGYSYGPPLAIAPLDQVRSVVEYAVTEIEPRQILLGMPNYAYDWTLPYIQGESRAENIGNEAAVSRAAAVGAEIQFSERAASPWYRYTRDGVRHTVWFEDVRSMEAKLALSDEFGLLGSGIWNLMRPFSQLWALLSTRYEIRKLIPTLSSTII